MSYRRCTTCGQEWKTRQDWLVDPCVVLVGYQASFVEFSAGLFLFNHMVAGCNTTMGIPAGDFFDLYAGPMFEGRKCGSKECPGFCLNKEELRSCPVQCECAFVREVLQVVMEWPKSRTG